MEESVIVCGKEKEKKEKKKWNLLPMLKTISQYIDFSFGFSGRSPINDNISI